MDKHEALIKRVEAQYEVIAWAIREGIDIDLMRMTWREWLLNLEEALHEEGPNKAVRRSQNT